jgi:MoxR-like ATPase
MEKTKKQINYNEMFTSKALGLVDRERETKQLMYALLTREHLLLNGPAGTAKSQFASNAFNSIDGAKSFNIHLTKQTTEEYVYGPLNILELKKGNLVHNTKDSILDADFAFLDEFFDASDVLLRSLLGVLNERLWMKGSQQISAKLHTAIITSNYQRENDVTQAILDRIIFKAKIQPTSVKSKRIEIYENYLKRPYFIPNKIIDFKELKELSSLIDSDNSVEISKEILEAYDLLLQEFVKESKKYISQRTANKALKLIKASALLDNRDKANFNDLEELKYIFCVLNERIEEEIFDAVFEKHIGKMEEEIQAIKDLDEMENKIKSMPKDFSIYNDIDFINKMREINEYIHLIEEMPSPTQKTNQRRNDILDKMRKLVIDNRDILFKKTGRANLND